MTSLYAQADQFEHVLRRVATISDLLSKTKYYPTRKEYQIILHEFLYKVAPNG